MHEIEVVKFRKSDNKPIAKKIMTYDNWLTFKKFNKEYYYKAYQLGFNSFDL